MKTIVSKRLNQRIDAPSVNALKLVALEIGTEVNVIEVLKGDTIEENNIWFRLQNGSFIWSGGTISGRTAGDTFQFVDGIIISLTEIVKELFNEIKEKLFSIQGVNGVNVERFIWKNGFTRGIVITTEQPELIESELFNFVISSSLVFRVPFKIVRASISIANTGGIQPGLKIKNRDNTSYGSICIPVSDSDGTLHFITCYHVVKHSTHYWKNYFQNNYSIVVNSDFDKIGQISKAILTSEIDAALIKLDDGIDHELIQNKINRLQIKSVRELNETDEYMLQVNMLGATTTREVRGIVLGTSASQLIRFPGTNNHIMDDLITIQDVKTHLPLSKPGDSGTLVYTKDGEAVCMIIASDEERSYAIKISKILKEFNVNLYTKNNTQ